MALRLSRVGQMENLPSPDRPTKQPIPLEVRDGDPVSIKLGGVEIVQAVEALQIEISGHGCWATVTVRVDVQDLDLGLDGAVVERQTAFELTAADIDQAIIMGGASESPGVRVLAYLEEQGLIAPS